MLGENIKFIRKQKGMTQEELAIRLNVVRQTVSKWEKELSVPDAVLLQKLSEVLETPVDKLLGAELGENAETRDIAEQLARISEQLAVKNRRGRTIWIAVASALFVLLVLFPLLSFALFGTYGNSGMSVSVSTSDLLYSQKDVDAAVETAQKSFRREFRGCTLEQISYDEDLNIARAAELARQYPADEAIILCATFRTSGRVSGKLLPSTSYRDVEWILTRNAGGQWTVREWGPESDFAFRDALKRSYT